MGKLLNMTGGFPLRVVIVEDDPVQSLFWKMAFERRYGDRVAVETYEDPREGVERLGPDVALLLVDWLMPYMEGADVIREAVKRGVSPKRMIIFSAMASEEIHKRLGSEECLAIIEKGDLEQEQILFRILDELTTPAVPTPPVS